MNVRSSLGVKDRYQELEANWSEFLDDLASARFNRISDLLRERWCLVFGIQ